MFAVNPGHVIHHVPLPVHRTSVAAHEQGPCGGPDRGVCEITDKWIENGISAGRDSTVMDVADSVAGAASCVSEIHTQTVADCVGWQPVDSSRKNLRRVAGS